MLRAPAQRRRPFDVNIVGDGPYLPTLKRLANEFGVASESGLLVPVRKPQAIRPALMQLVQSPQLAQKPELSARERVIAPCNWRGVIAQYLEVYGRFKRS